MTISPAFTVKHDKVCNANVIEAVSKSLHKPNFFFLFNAGLEFYTDLAFIPHLDVYE